MARGILQKDQIDGRFFIQGHMEMLDILVDLLYRDEPLLMHFPGMQGVPPSSRLVEAGIDSLLVAVPGEFDSSLLEASSCVFAAFPDGIRVQFQCGTPQRTDWDGHVALKLPFPGWLARIQRQESFRTTIDPDEAPEIRLFAPDGVELEHRPLHDLSSGGLGIAVPGEAANGLVRRIARVAFSLGEFGDIDCAVAVKHATVLEEAGQHRIGMSFCGLSTEQRARIQRYVTATEYRRRGGGRESEEGGDRDI